jgi:type II secretory pathway pseudopilin PulG
LLIGLSNKLSMPQLRNCRCPRGGSSERGYILLILMLFVALLAIAAGALAPTIAFQVRRDREEEMIHRGTQYSRAIRRYVKKTGRYPSRLEDLENTNNIRFLRKRYKDPITNKDFKVLHVGEVQLTGMAGIAGAAALGGGSIPGASAVGAMAQGASTMGAAGTGSMLRGNPNQPVPGGPTEAAGVDNSPDAGQAKPDPSPGGSPQTESGPSAAGGDKLSSRVFGGGPIVGVASISKAQSIREFNHKNHYDKWQFIYDPTMDRGGLITTPAQPALQVAAPIQQNSSSSGQNPPGMNPFGGQQSPPPAQPTQQQQP